MKHIGIIIGAIFKQIFTFQLLSNGTYDESTSVFLILHVFTLQSIEKYRIEIKYSVIFLNAYLVEIYVSYHK